MTWPVAEPMKWLFLLSLVPASGETCQSVAAMRPTPPQAPPMPHRFRGNIPPMPRASAVVHHQGLIDVRGHLPPPVHAASVQQLHAALVQLQPPMHEKILQPRPTAATVQPQPNHHAANLQLQPPMPAAALRPQLHHHGRTCNCTCPYNSPAQ